MYLCLNTDLTPVQPLIFLLYLSSICENIIPGLNSETVQIGNNFTDCDLQDEKMHSFFYRILLNHDVLMVGYKNNTTIHSAQQWKTSLQKDIPGRGQNKMC